MEFFATNTVLRYQAERRTLVIFQKVGEGDILRVFSHVVNVINKAMQLVMATFDFQPVYRRFLSVTDDSGAFRSDVRAKVT